MNGDPIASEAVLHERVVQVAVAQKRESLFGCFRSQDTRACCLRDWRHRGVAV